MQKWWVTYLTNIRLLMARMRSMKGQIISHLSVAGFFFWILVYKDLGSDQVWQFSCPCDHSPPIWTRNDVRGSWLFLPIGLPFPHYWVWLQKLSWRTMTVVSKEFQSSKENTWTMLFLKETSLANVSENEISLWELLHASTYTPPRIL